MTREQILQIVRATPNFGKVAHEEFADYVLALSKRVKTDDGWQTTEHPYMTVDGKLAMANQDHARLAKRLDFSAPQILVDNEDQLTLMVTVTSEMYGTRHGIATSRRLGGSEIERLFPWEVAETSAIGRALSAMGYGLFPGSGLASADDMLRATSYTNTTLPQAAANEPRRVPLTAANTAVNEPERRTPAAAANTQRTSNETRSQYTRSHPPLSPVQRNKLTELWRILNGGGTDEQVAEGLDKLFVESFKHGLADATYEEGARLTGQLLTELRSKTNTTA